MEAVGATAASCSILNLLVKAAKQVILLISDECPDLYAVRDGVKSLVVQLKLLQRDQEMHPELAKNVPLLLDNCLCVQNDLEDLKREFLANSAKWTIYGKEKLASLQSRLQTFTSSCEVMFQGLNIEQSRSWKKSIDDMMERSKPRSSMLSLYPEAESANAATRAPVGDALPHIISTHGAALRNTKTWRSDDASPSPGSGVTKAVTGSTQSSSVPGRDLMDAAHLRALGVLARRSVGPAESTLEECNQTLQALMDLQSKHEKLLENDAGAQTAVDGAIAALQAALDRVRPGVESCVKDPERPLKSILNQIKWLSHDRKMFKKHLPDMVDKYDKALLQIGSLERMATDAASREAADMLRQRVKMVEKEAEGLERLNSFMGH
ncbi:hypothetical protein MAC_09032 [Metarhizium acridum CQMa 102]|uniref:Uncharacterized protein n=1 Tax=Metarhizium acridum (strain CQMa 102) TaxID=655827 RepID=E9EGN4_METAQ|nr:uncharacterized protein MAC_09032 [Metarhizium acridum CQMa 102]EFY84922.1 hypothetical protein MAC_09032 [Metarhizium acridum CQMa 102]